MERAYSSVVVLFWAAAMSWLFLTKIFPVLDSTPQPTPGFTGGEAASEQTCWGIECQGKVIGYASNDTMSDGKGNVQVASSVQLHDLPIGELITDFLNSWSYFARWASPVSEDTSISVATETTMRFIDGQLDDFTSLVNVDNMGTMFELHGIRESAGLRVEVVPGKMLADGGFEESLFSSVLPVPKETLVVDALSPYSKLKNLRVGQRWQMRSYRAFPPTQPIRTIEAHVARSEMLLWEGEITTCYIVTLTDADRGGPTAVSSSVGSMWIDDDGTVLRQQMMVGGIELDFIRKPRAFCDSKLPYEAMP